MQKSLAWTEKYRPKRIKDIVGHQEIRCVLQQYLQKKNFPHLLFYGPSGIGKSTSILCLLKELCGDSNVSQLKLELNASDDRGIDVVRTQIKNFAQTRNLFLQDALKIIVLEEADAMTMDAQSALRVPMEKYAATVRFCILCNDVSKIHPAIQSRCSKFEFNPLDRHSVLVQLSNILKAETMTQYAINDGNEMIDMNDVSETLSRTMSETSSKGTSAQMPQSTIAALESIVDICGLDLRACINFLQTYVTNHSSANLTAENIYLSVGKCPKTICESMIYEITTTKSTGVDSVITFDTIHTTIKQILCKYGCCLNDFAKDIVDCLVLRLPQSDKPQTMRIQMLLKELSQFLHYLTLDVDIIIHTAGLAAIFYRCTHDD